MAFSKAKYFDKIPYEQSCWAKAQAHPARIIILSYLLEHGITPFYEICMQIPLAKTTISQHIRQLRKDGYLDVEEKYPTTYYSLNKENCKDLAIKLLDLNSGFI